MWPAVEASKIDSCCEIQIPMKLYTSKHFRSADGTYSGSNLIDQCLQGDQGAWEALVHSYKNLIYSLCSKYRSRMARIFEPIELTAGSS